MVAKWANRFRPSTVLSCSLRILPLELGSCSCACFLENKSMVGSKGSRCLFSWKWTSSNAWPLSQIAWQPWQACCRHMLFKALTETLTTLENGLLLLRAACDPELGNVTPAKNGLATVPLWLRCFWLCFGDLRRGSHSFGAAGCAEFSVYCPPIGLSWPCVSQLMADREAHVQACSRRGDGATSQYYGCRFFGHRAWGCTQGTHFKAFQSIGFCLYPYRFPFSLVPLTFGLQYNYL